MSSEDAHSNVTQDQEAPPQESHRISSILSLPSRVLRRNRSPITDGRYDHFHRDKIEDYPRGYPKLAAYVNSDIDGRMYRRFGWMRTRLLLYLQDELSKMEEDMMTLDRQHAQVEPYRLCSRRYEHEDPPNDKRAELMVQIGTKFKEYDELLLREHEIMSIQPPSKNAHLSYFNYIWNEKDVAPDEYRFIFQRDDFIAVGIREENWMASFAGLMEAVIPKKILKFCFVTPGDKEKSSNTDIQFYSNSRTTKFAKALVGCVTTLLLVLPIVILYLLTVHHASGGLMIGVLLLFVVAFAIALATLTRASRHEMFAASAAYCAVLVVFLSNVPQGKWYDCRLVLPFNRVETYYMLDQKIIGSHRLKGAFLMP